MGFVAYDISWDVDVNDAVEKIDEMTAAEAAEWLGMPKDRYANMNTSERHDIAYEFFHHNYGALCELFELPDEVEIPDEFGITSENDDFQEVTDWMSDEYGFCIDDYSVREDKELENG